MQFSQPCYVPQLLAVAAIVFASGCQRREPTDDSDRPLALQAGDVRAGKSSQLRLDHTLVRPDDLAALDGIEDRVERVNFSRSELDDEALARVCRCSNLEQLRIESPKITDLGMEHVARLAKLRFLHLLDAPITDAGLDRIHGLTTLESVYLDHTRVTDAGIARLLAALPKVHLHLNDHHHPLDQHAGDHEHGK